MCHLRNIAMHDYLESVTTGQTNTRTDGQTDVGPSDPYVPLCLAGDTKMSLNIREVKILIICIGMLITWYMYQYNATWLFGHNWDCLHSFMWFISILTSSHVCERHGYQNKWPGLWLHSVHIATPSCEATELCANWWILQSLFHKEDIIMGSTKDYTWLSKNWMDNLNAIHL